MTSRSLLFIRSIASFSLSLTHPLLFSQRDREALQ